MRRQLQSDDLVYKAGVLSSNLEASSAKLQRSRFIMHLEKLMLLSLRYPYVRYKRTKDTLALA